MKASQRFLSLCLAPASLVILSAGIVSAQTYYSPGGVGVVSSFDNKNQDLAASIYSWDLNSNTTAGGDRYTTSPGNGTLTITSGVFQVVLGSGVDLNNSFWNVNQNWAQIIAVPPGASANPILTIGTVSAYSYSGPADGSGTFTLLNTSARGSFSLSGTDATGYSVTWSAIPEPTSALAGLLLVSGLLRHRRVCRG
jgi:hypothetical protein